MPRWCWDSAANSSDNKCRRTWAVQCFAHIFNCGSRRSCSTACEFKNLGVNSSTIFLSNWQLVKHQSYIFDCWSNKLHSPLCSVPWGKNKKNTLLSWDKIMNTNSWKTMLSKCVKKCDYRIMVILTSKEDFYICFPGMEYKMLLLGNVW